jgi:cell shape-determining protein MreC
MKTNYLPRSKRGSGKNKKLGLIVAVFVICVLLAGILKGPILSVVSPVWKGKNFVSSTLGNIGGYFKTKSSLIRENNELKDRLDSYESLIISARSIEKQNENLTALVGRSEEKDGIIGGVVSRPPATPYDILVLDAGTSLGVEVGKNVYTEEGYALGRISEVASHTSRVTLYTLPGEKTDAVLERGMVPIILVGAGGGDFKVALPRDMDVVVGDRILIAGSSGRLVAVVGDVSLKPTDSFKEVIAYTPVSLSRIRAVFINR